MSPKTKLLMFTMVVAIVFIALMYVSNVNVRVGYYFYASFIIAISIILYALLVMIASKFKRPVPS